MNLKKYFLLVTLAFALLSCTNENQQITKVEDYQAFLTIEDNEQLDFAEAERTFWVAKYNTNPDQVSYLTPLAASHTQLFEAGGKIEHLKTSEKYLTHANQKTAYKNAGLLRALAKNYLTQHRFKEALHLLKKAHVLGEKKLATQKMLFDVYLELGDDINAKKYLEAIENFNDFDYLIRLSKWQDHKGDLLGAIRFMEQGKAKAEALKNKELMLWSYSNLADFYGHNGQIQASYRHYLKALDLDSNYYYALKGIAWILFSHEKNTSEAFKIIDAIVKSYHAPDLQLFKAELAEFDNDFQTKEKYLQHYFKMTNDADYGAMYNSYSAILYADQIEHIDKAISIANAEVKNRPTPQSYDLLAWVYYKKGDYKKALQLIESHVVGKTFEPAILYHIAEIYKANNKNELVIEIKKELLESTFELGPLMEQQIKQL